MGKNPILDKAFILTIDKAKSGVHAWCDNHAPPCTDVCPNPLRKGKKTTVRQICAVGAHPPFANKGGLVNFGFTTSTTNMHRRVNTKLEGSTRDHSFAYTGSLLPTSEAVVAVTVNDIQALGHQQPRRLHIRHMHALQVVQLSGI